MFGWFGKSGGQPLGAPVGTLPGWVVTQEWLEANLRASDLRIVQVGGDNFYHRLHIPGALYVGFSDMVESRAGVMGMRADATTLTKLFSRLGIGPETNVVAYDASGGLDAGRFIWTLASLGHQRGAILDGGLWAWSRAERETEYQLPQVASVAFKANPDPRWEADIERVSAISRGELPGILVDTRAPHEYTGSRIMGRGGHIAGAVHFNWTDALVSTREPLLREREELLGRFHQLGLTDPAGEVVVYCRSAHRAAQTWVLLRSLGYDDVRLYDGSMLEWEAWRHPLVFGDQPHGAQG